MSSDFIQILKALKTGIKSRGFTYKSLAQELKMSEAGVKRLLNAEDCSLQRILKICKIIGVPLKDLIAISTSLEEEVQKFSQEQIELFNKFPEYLRYYYKLRVERQTPQEIQGQLGINSAKNQKILSALDRVNLIQLLPGNRLGDLGRRNVYWKNLGQVFLNLKYEFTEDLINYFKTREKKDKGFYPIYHLKLSDKSRYELYNDLNKTIEKYIKKSELESLALKKENIHPLNIAFILAPITAFRNPAVLG